MADEKRSLVSFVLYIILCPMQMYYDTIHKKNKKYVRGNVLKHLNAWHKAYF